MANSRLSTRITSVACMAVAAIMLLVSASAAQPGYRNRTAVLKVLHKPVAWTDSHLTERLLTELSRHGNGSIINADLLAESVPQFPSNIFNLDSLINWGAETGQRYLVIVAVEFEGLKRSKTFNIPLIFHKYENIGVISGELRVIDILRKRLVMTESFKVEKEGKRIIQATTDDDINDADLHISAPDKLRFFRELETELARRLATKIKATTSLK